MARIAIIGGHGKVALLLEPKLVERGDEVHAIIRNPEHIGDVEATGATAVVADIEQLDTTALAELLAGSDAIVWSAGAGGGDPRRTYAVDRDAAIRSIDAAEAAGVLRYVMVSYWGAGPDHGIPEDEPFFAYAESKTQADAHLRESDLDWTILQPSTLTLDPGTGSIAVGAEGDRSGKVSREDVASVIAVALVTPQTIGRSIRFNGGQTPIAEALAAES
jgi:uncharacterized protein YbjT (DUF2867 family)